MKTNHVSVIKKNSSPYQMILFTVLMLISSHVAAQYSLFDDTYVHEIRISSSDPNFWQQLDDDYNAWLNGSATDIPYLPATVSMDGTVLDDVGVRQKGFSSNFFTDSTKKPLKLNFGKFVEDREFDGVRKLNLMNGVGDASISKDKLVYDMFRMHGVPGPRVAHAKIYVNDVFWGVYGIIEQVDKRYLKRNFADNDGELWKNKGNTSLQWSGSDPLSYPFELQTNEETNDWSKFIGFVDFINNSSDAEFATQLKDIFELDEYFRILAIDILTNNWDSYLQHGRNWYMYYEPKIDKMHWLPWDYNFAFDRKESGSEDLDLIQDVAAAGADKVLTTRVFAVSEYREKILNYMCEILEVNFTNQRIDPMLDSQLNLVLSEWGASNEFFDTMTVNDSVNANNWDGAFRGVSQGLKRFITDRSIVIQNELVSEGHTCVNLNAAIDPKDVVINEFMARNDDDSPWSDQDGDFDDWIELYNNTDSPISLDNYFISDTSSFIHKWEIPAGTVIPANGYLIIWADKDPHQVGLHTKFSLDKDGEEIIFSYIDGTIIDSVTFGEQEKERSLSRSPNGTGPFFDIDVTFDGPNGDAPDVIYVSGFETL